MKAISSKAEARKLAKQAGLAVVDISQFDGAAQVGAMLEKVNPLHVGLSMHAFSKAKLEEAIRTISTEISANPEPEILVILMELQRKLIAEYNVTASSIIKSIESRPPEKTGGDTVFALPPNTVLTAVIPSKLEKNENGNTEKHVEQGG